MLAKINVNRVVETLREAMTEQPFDDKEEEIKVKFSYDPDEAHRLNNLLYIVKTLRNDEWEYLVKEREKESFYPARIINHDEVNQARGNHQYSTKDRYKFLVRAVGQTVDYITDQLDGLTDRELQLFIQMLATSLRFEYGFTKMEGSANEK